MRNLSIYVFITVIMFIGLKGKAQPEGCDYDCLCEALGIVFSTTFDCYHYCDCCPTCIYEPDSLIKFMNLHESDSGNIWQIANINKGDWIGDFDPYNNNDMALITDSVNPYPPDNHSVFEVKIEKPTCMLWTGTGYCWGMMHVSFNYKSDTDTLVDGLYIEVSFDDGQTYANAQDTIAVKLLPNGPKIINPNECKQLRNSYGISGKNNRVFFIQFSWDSLSHGNVQSARIRFNFISDSIETYKKGILLDRLMVTVSHNCFTKIPNILNEEEPSIVNPINENTKLTFNNSMHKLYYLNITDINGRNIFKGNTNEDYFNIGEIIKTPGIYIYNLYTNNKIIKTDKIIKL